MHSVLSQVMSTEGVVGVSQPHFWELSSSHYVGTVKVQVAATANEQMVRFHVANLFREAGVRDVVVQVEKDSAVTY